MTRRLLLALLAGTFIITSFSCDKAVSDTNPFFGNWKASYDDTVTFALENGKNILIYDVSGSPGGPIPGITNDHEFDYKDGKFYIKEGIGTTSGFRHIPSFAWVEEGKQFTIEKTEWLSFISSTGKFTFTKIIY
jgi:hypothetical protein